MLKTLLNKQKMPLIVIWSVTLRSHIGETRRFLSPVDVLITKNFSSTEQRILTYLLTHSMVQSPSWEANRFTASQEILRISRNPKVHYRTHKSPPPVSILGQPNPVHIHPTTWRSVLILSTNLRLGLPSGLFPSGFPTKTLYTLLSSPISATCPAHLTLQSKHPACECFLTKFFTGRVC